MRYELVIFDLDGTILNTLEDLGDALNHALAASGFPTRTMQEVRQFIGNGIRNLIRRGAPEGTEDAVIDRLHRDFTAYYNVHCADKTRPYGGILPVLAALREAGIRTAVVSNKPNEAVQVLCAKYFPGLFDMAVGERTGIRRKPAPDSVFAVLEELEIVKENAVYIGDSEVDIQTACNAGMDCISVDWGFRDDNCLRQAGAACIVAAPEQLLSQLQ